MSSTWRDRLILPTYQAKDAAWLAGISPQTLSGWFYGYPQSSGERERPVFAEGKVRRSPLSYLQLVEVAFVATCRDNGISLRRIKQTRAYLAAAFHVDYPFADLRLRTAGPHIVTELEPEAADRLVIADASGQIVWRTFIEERIDQFDYENSMTLRWFPRGKQVPIFIDPRMNFGSPMLAASGMPTWVIADAIRTGESDDEIMLDYGVNAAELAHVRSFDPILKAA